MKKWEAVPQVRYGQFHIRRPAILNKIKALKLSQEVSGMYAVEETADTDGEWIAWFVMTNGPVEHFAAAYEQVCWYTQQWKIERFHYVLQSGCAVEKLQERTYGQNDRISTDIFDYSGSHNEPDVHSPAQTGVTLRGIF